jgi:hypothetical protein
VADEAGAPKVSNEMFRQRADIKGPAVAMLVLVVVVIVAGPTGTATGEGSAAGDPFAFLRPSIQISESERRKIDGGEVVVKILPGREREVAVFAAGTLQAGGDTLVRRVRDIVDLKKSSYVPAIARFSDPPDMTDLSALILDDVDLRAIQDCRPGDCDVKLGAGDIERLHEVIAANGNGWKVAVTEEFWRLVLERVNAYLARGHRGISDYHARREPVNLASTFAMVLQRTAFLRARADVAAYLEQYPTVDWR